MKKQTIKTIIAIVLTITTTGYLSYGQEKKIQKYYTIMEPDKQNFIAEKENHQERKRNNLKQLNQNLLLL